MENKTVEVDFLLALIEEKMKEHQAWLHFGSHYRQGVVDGLKSIREQLIKQG